MPLYSKFRGNKGLLQEDNDNNRLKYVEVKKLIQMAFLFQNHG